MKILSSPFFKKSLLSATAFVLLVAPLSAQTGDPYLDQLERKARFALSDYTEAIGTCNATMQKSAIQRLSDVRKILIKHLEANAAELRAMSKRHNEILSEVGPLVGVDSGRLTEAKLAGELFSSAISASSEIGSKVLAPIGVANSIYSAADKKALEADARDIVERGRRQLQEIEKAHARQQSYFDLAKRIDAKEERLRRSFDRQCGVGRNDITPYTRASNQHQRGKIKVTLKGQDRASGDIFEGVAKNLTQEPRTVVMPVGSHLVAADGVGQRMVVTKFVELRLNPEEEKSFTLEGFCLDPKEAPPSPTSSYSILPPQKFPSGPYYGGRGPAPAWNDVENVPELVQKMIADGRLPKTGLPPEMEKLTLTQWLIWNEYENFSPEDGRKKIDEQAGDRATPEQKDKLNENIWAGVDLVKKESAKQRGN